MTRLRRKSMSIAEAIREGIREEMRRDPTVFCIGEDIGIPGGFGGAFTVTLGLSDEFGHERMLDTPISELGLAGVAVGAAMAGLRPIADVQYSRLPVPGHGPTGQQRGQDALHVGRDGEGADGDARARGRDGPRLAARAEHGSLLLPRAGPQGRRAVDGLRRQRA